jgi:hypothetical protein
MSNKSQITLFSPALMPNATLRSAAHVSALAPNEFTTLNNWRFDGRAPNIRGGIALDRPTTGFPASYELRGCLRHELGDWAAVLDNGTSKVRVYQWDAGGVTWQEITDGTTRFSDTGYVEFQIVNTPIYPGITDFDDANNNYIIWQNGTELPRIRNASYSGGYSSRLHQRFAPPIASMCKAQPVPSSYYNTQGSLTLTSSGGGLTFTEPSVTTGGKKILLTATTSSASGHHATVQFASGITFTEAPRQIQIVFDSTDSFIWSRLRLAIFDGTTQYILYDPTENPEAITLQAIDDKYAVALIDIDTVYDTALNLVTGGLPTGINFDRIRLQWVDSAPAATTTISLYAVVFGGGIRWGVQAGVAYFGHLSRAESPGVVCTNVPAPYLKDAGGTPIPNTRLAMNTAARYNLRVTTHKYAPLSANATRVIPYLLTASGYDFLQAAVDPTDISSTSTREVVTMLLTEEATISRTMPSEFHESIPIGKSMAHTGSRLVVANGRVADVTVTAGNGEVWMSAHDQPFRFSRTAIPLSTGEIRPDSPIVNKVGTHELVKVLTMSSSYAGSDPVVVWSGREVWRMEGSDASTLSRPYLVSRYGTRSPHSVVRFGASALYLDSSRQVRVLHDPRTAISRTYVDDKLKGIPDARLPHVSAALFQDRYYLAITPLTDTNNTQILIFDTRTNGWFSDSTSSTARFQRLFATVEGEREKLFFFSTNAGVYEHENTSATLDIGTDITAIMRFRELAPQSYTSTIAVHRVGISCDKVADEQVTIRRYPSQSGAAATSTIIDIGAARSTGETDDLQVHRWDRSAGDGDVVSSRKDVGISVQLEAALPSGWTLKRVFAEVEIYDGHSSVDTA